MNHLVFYSIKLLSEPQPVQEIQASDITSEPFLSSTESGNYHVLSPQLILNSRNRVKINHRGKKLTGAEIFLLLINGLDRPSWALEP